MAVITVSRKFGSLGGDIAEQVAQNLGYHFVDKEFIGEVLREYGINFASEYDHIPSFWEKFIAQSPMRSDEMVILLNRVITALAHHGNVVIQGRSSYLILGGLADVLNVRIQAPFDFRVRQVMKFKGIGVDRADALIKHGDKVRSSFVKTFYGVQWEDSSAFDLVINTGKVAPDLAISWIVAAAQALDEKDAGDQPTTASTEVDSVMAGVVSEALKYNAAYSL